MEPNSDGNSGEKGSTDEEAEGVRGPATGASPPRSKDPAHKGRLREPSPTSDDDEGNALARATPRVARPLKCQVDGCGVDLTQARKYFQRYRVCERHLKAPLLHMDGQSVRFCDQCSRFHDITMFEGSRRTCSEKLQRTRQARSDKRRQQSLQSERASLRTHARFRSSGGGGGMLGKRAEPFSCDNDDDADMDYEEELNSGLHSMPVRPKRGRRLPSGDLAATDDLLLGGGGVAAGLLSVGGGIGGGGGGLSGGLGGDGHDAAGLLALHRAAMAAGGGGGVLGVSGGGGGLLRSVAGGYSGLDAPASAGSLSSSWDDVAPALPLVRQQSVPSPTAGGGGGQWLLGSAAGALRRGGGGGGSGGLDRSVGLGLGPTAAAAAASNSDLASTSARSTQLLQQLCSLRELTTAAGGGGGGGALGGLGGVLGNLAPPLGALPQHPLAAALAALGDAGGRSSAGGGGGSVPAVAPLLQGGDAGEGRLGSGVAGGGGLGVATAAGAAGTLLGRGGGSRLLPASLQGLDPLLQERLLRLLGLNGEAPAQDARQQHQPLGGGGGGGGPQGSAHQGRGGGLGMLGGGLSSAAAVSAFLDAAKAERAAQGEPGDARVSGPAGAPALAGPHDKQQQQRHQLHGRMHSHQQQPPIRAEAEDIKPGLQPPLPRAPLPRDAASDARLSGSDGAGGGGGLPWRGVDAAVEAARRSAAAATGGAERGGVAGRAEGPSSDATTLVNRLLLQLAGDQQVGAALRERVAAAAAAGPTSSGGSATARGGGAGAGAGAGARLAAGRALPVLDLAGPEDAGAGDGGRDGGRDGSSGGGARGPWGGGGGGRVRAAEAPRAVLDMEGRMGSPQPGRRAHARLEVEAYAPPRGGLAAAGWGAAQRDPPRPLLAAAALGRPQQAPLPPLTQEQQQQPALRGGGDTGSGGEAGEEPRQQQEQQQQQFRHLRQLQEQLRQLGVQLVLQ